ncbi:MAG: NADH-quinone oxidoreductase subunit I [Verrucomicrobia bacterium]|nr:NADH-quinone oxidoreductase subunit I [Verrucomicrobiota bacterium]
MDSPAPTTRDSSPPPPTRWAVPGIGLLKGLAVTGLNMLQSYYRKERMTTVQYPEERAPISPNFRNFPFLVYDGDEAMAGLRCTACSICEKECPPQCIYIVLDRDENGKSLKRPKVFDIDVSVCMNCGICAEVCPFDSIYMDGEYELATDNRFGDLLFHKERLARSTDYHAKLRPLQAAEVAARRKAEEDKKLAAQAAKEAKAKLEKEPKELKAKEEPQKGAGA